MDSTLVAKNVTDRSQFLRKCVQIIITEQRGMKLQTHPQSQCQFKPLTADGSSIQTDGNGCLIAVTPGSRIAMEQVINKDCYESSFLNQNQIQSGDYESVLKLWPVAVEAEKLNILSPIGLRYLRHTLLPSQGFMPRAAKDTVESMSFISALSTNVSPGTINIQSIGQNRVLIQPTFLVENLAKDFCLNGTCAKISSYVAPIAGLIKLYKLNTKSNKQTEIAQWAHALKVPSNWSGMAEFRAENNLSGISMGALETDMKLNAGDEFTLAADFFEPRTLIDELMATQNYLELNSNLAVGESSSSEALPTLPKVGQIGQLEKMPSLPSVGLGYKGILELSDQFNMKKNWTQTYDRVCNSVNMNCMKLSGLNKPFSSIKMRFKIGANKEIIPLSVEKQSPVFENYKQNVQSFAKKVCI
jgi:hypothetical protein